MVTHPAALLLTFWLLGAQSAPATGGLAAAKALYVAADYESALAALASIPPGEVSDEADQYRALCLLALNRVEDAERTLQSLIARNPAFTMSEADVSPRLVVLFQNTRRRAMPALVRARYLEARTDFERGNYEQAAARFRALLALLAPEETTADDLAAQTDLRLPAEGFLTLAEAALATRRMPAGPAATAAVPPPASAAIGRASADEDAIGQLVRKYAEAYVALDADAVLRLGAGDRRSLQTAFGALKSQTVDARDLKIAMSPGGDGATVTLTWAVEATPKVGGARKTKTPATLRLAKSAGGEWTIVERR